MKSPPELWSQCSDAASLARHLSGFGEISITRLEPESTVAWEGESVSGTVTLEASGWGTRVALTAVPPITGPAPAGRVPGVVAPARGLSALFGTLIKRRREEPLAGGVGPDLVAELEAALDSLGAAHHRPYSRG